jgi:hypothetical protein
MTGGVRVSRKSPRRSIGLWLPLFIVLIGLVLGAVIYFKFPRDSRSGLRSLLAAMLGAPCSSDVHIYNGARELPDGVRDNIIRSVIAPYFRGATLEDCRTERLGTGNSVIYARLLRSGQTSYYILNGSDVEGGVAVQLRRLLETCWEHTFAHNSSSSSALQDRRAHLTGFLRDVDLLRRCDLDGLDVSGTIRSWDEMEALYRDGVRRAAAVPMR